MRSLCLGVLVITLAATSCSKLRQTLPKAVIESLNFSEGWSFTISTFNVYCLPLFAPDKKERMTAIGYALAQRKIDVATLQENWTSEGRRDLLRGSALASSAYFDKEGTLGSGLFLITPHTIDFKNFWPFTLDGRFLRFWEGDRATAKGIAMIKFTKDGIPLDIFDMHTLARYKDYLKPSDSYTPERLAQLFEAFDFIVTLRDSAAFALGADFNSDNGSEEFKFWLELTGLETSALSGDNSCTYCPPNSFVESTQGQLDHISISPVLAFSQVSRDFEDKIFTKKGEWTSLSDHFGLTAKIVSRNAVKTLTPDIFKAIHYLKWRLEDYLTWYSPLGRPDDQPGKLEIKKQIEYVLKRVVFYIGAVESHTDLSPEAKDLDHKVQSYLALFKN